jgi:hypothetical protein
MQMAVHHEPNLTGYAELTECAAITDGDLMRPTID